MELRKKQNIGIKIDRYTMTEEEIKEQKRLYHKEYEKTRKPRLVYSGLCVDKFLNKSF